MLISGSTSPGWHRNSGCVVARRSRARFFGGHRWPRPLAGGLRTQMFTQASVSRDHMARSALVRAAIRERRIHLGATVSSRMRWSAAVAIVLVGTSVVIIWALGRCAVGSVLEILADAVRGGGSSHDLGIHCRRSSAGRRSLPLEAGLISFAPGVSPCAATTAVIINDDSHFERQSYCKHFSFSRSDVPARTYPRRAPVVVLATADHCRAEDSS